MVLFCYRESSSKQATIGKRAFGLVVTDPEYQRISFGRATVRWIAKIISALILYIGFIMIGFTRRKQGLHDMVAGTYVCDKSWL
nr:RDD family protein [Methanolacinia petrolearia]